MRVTTTVASPHVESSNAHRSIAGVLGESGKRDSKRRSGVLGERGNDCSTVCTLDKGDGEMMVVVVVEIGGNVVVVFLDRFCTAVASSSQTWSSSCDRKRS